MIFVHHRQFADGGMPVRRPFPVYQCQICSCFTHVQDAFLQHFKQNKDIHKKFSDAEHKMMCNSGVCKFRTGSIDKLVDHLTQVNFHLVSDDCPACIVTLGPAARLLVDDDCLGEESEWSSRKTAAPAEDEAIAVENSSATSPHINVSKSVEPDFESEFRAVGTDILWQFLKELLAQPDHFIDVIRWLDRKQGLFKVEDSDHLARLWGVRKGRPAMNFDKLSRSIRQYYRRGVMKKPNPCPRLVYQFCQGYLL